jgi:uncharacterized protein YjbI with pentapeptide repeats
MFEQGGMQSATITPENFSTIEWHDNYFKYCNFEGLIPSGEHVDSDFNACSFKDIDWYWGLFNTSNFIECRFENCIFRGSGFPDCKFVECIFTNCQFLKDNLNAECTFESAIAYGCQLENSVGFGALIVGAPRPTTLFK